MQSDVQNDWHIAPQSGTVPSSAWVQPTSAFNLIGNHPA